MRFLSNVPTLKVILDPARIDYESDGNRRRISSKSLVFKHGVCKVTDQDIIDRALKRICTSEEQGLTRNFHVHPADMEEAEARCEKLGLKLPKFNFNAGRTQLADTGEKMPGKLAGQVHQGVETSAPRVDQEKEALRAENEAMKARLAKLEAGQDAGVAEGSETPDTGAQGQQEAPASPPAPAKRPSGASRKSKPKKQTA